VTAGNLLISDLLESVDHLLVISSVTITGGGIAIPLFQKVCDLSARIPIPSVPRF
jgi:hypothetical protein